MFTDNNIPKLQNHRMRSIAFGLLLVLLSACSSNLRNTPFSSKMPPAVNMNGMMVGNGNWKALYTYAADTPQQSKCVDECTKQWLPLYATQDHDMKRGDFDVIQRPDGKKQWTLMGKPLYYWTHDVEAGKAEGSKIDPDWKPFLVP